MNRRGLILGGAGLAALGVAEALRPRNRLLLLKGGTIEDSMPAEFGPWSATETGDLVSPALSGRLTQALYSELVARIYFDRDNGDGVMILAAYGDTQSDLLQLHRPEYCYPAVGFNLAMSKPDAIPLGQGMLPVRRVVAEMEDRRENIVYWTRMGEALPQSAEQQRATRLKNSIDGIIPDGILMRTSMLGDTDRAFSVLDRFIPALLQAMPVKYRQAFVGTKLSRQFV